jgi:hypothetical protein
MERTQQTIYSRVQLLKKKALRTKPGGLRLKRWTVEEDEQLRAALAACKRPAAIAKQLKRSEPAVIHRLYHLGTPLRGVSRS